MDLPRIFLDNKRDTKNMVNIAITKNNEKSLICSKESLRPS